MLLKTKRKQFFLGVGLLWLAAVAHPASAAQFGPFSYEVVSDSVHITRYPTSRSGRVRVPTYIEGYPVTHIGSQAFEQCYDITSVVLPIHITHIGNYAFGLCEELVSINIPAGVVSIGEDAFYNCENLRSVSLPAGLVDLGRGAFRSSGLRSITIPSGFTEVPPVLCSSCSQLSTVVLPDSIVTIGGSAFSYTSIGSIALPTSVQVIGASAFARTPLREFTVPPLVDSIGNQTFDGCDRLHTISFHSGVVEIGASAFRNCTSLEAIELPENLSAIGGEAFSGSSLQSVRIPTSVTEIPWNCFAFCQDLHTCDLPEGLVNIGSSAFQTTSLETVVLPSSVELVQSRAFWLREHRVVCLGDAPELGFIGLGSASSTTVYYLRSKGGFSTPEWEGYTTVEIDDIAMPAAAWLLSNGMWYDTAVTEDLLLPYALDVAPHTHASSGQVVEIVEGSLRISFYGGREDITYQVEASGDGISWSSAEVTLSAPSPDGVRVATAPLGLSSRLMRLKVTQNP